MMTEQTQTEEPLAPVPTEALSLTRAGRPFTIAELADKLAPKTGTAAEAKPPRLPVPATLTETAQAALQKLAQVFDSFDLTEVRPLTGAEQKRLTDEAVTITQILDPLRARLDAIGAMVMAHIDQVAQDAPVITSGKHEGHRLAAGPGDPFRVAVDGFEQAWEQRYVAGKAVPQVARLKALLDEGQITREEYLALTSVPDVPRVLDDNKFKRMIGRNPERALEILAAITERTEPTAQFVSPKK